MWILIFSKFEASLCHFCKAHGIPGSRAEAAVGVVARTLDIQHQTASMLYRMVVFCGILQVK
jgi:hypothetical protein